MFDPRLRLIFLTDASQTKRPLIDVIGEAVTAGVRAIIVREKNLSDEERSLLLENVSTIAKPAGCLVLAASRSSVDVDGIHLASSDDMPVTRPPIVGRSCHNLSEVQAAERQGCDYVTVSPIFETPSKPGYGPALGGSFIESVTDQVDIPVIALGGINRRNASACLTAGASGAAVMGEIMRSNSVSQLVQSLCNDLAVPLTYPGAHG